MTAPGELLKWHYHAITAALPGAAVTSRVMILRFEHAPVPAAAGPEFSVVKAAAKQQA